MLETQRPYFAALRTLASKLHAGDTDRIVLAKIADALELTALDFAALDRGEEDYDMAFDAPRPSEVALDVEVACNGCSRIERVRLGGERINGVKTILDRLIEALALAAGGRGVAGWGAVNGWDEVAAKYFRANGRKAWLCCTSIDEAMLCAECSSIARYMRESADTCHAVAQ
ncbi:MAG TPA: hypothetical protein VNF29_14960 [Candidatus Binataceae bacterium]|nr:hypothetical protein [Candidatus Binataceae bacterium]HVA82225.1 hypothetical protein [Candidatus Binataceae bacterium]